MDPRPRFPDRASISTFFPVSSNRRDVFGQDNGKLSRQPSFQNKKKNVTENTHPVKSSKLSRTSTFHISPTEKPQAFHRNSSSRNLPPPSSDTLTQRIRDLQLPAEGVESTDSLDEKLTRKSSSRSTIADSERKERKRRQNTESARRARERKRNEMERLERAYDANEVRIKELELMADELSRELRRHNTISSVPRNRHNNDFKNGEDRPKWFGAAF